MPTVRISAFVPPSAPASSILTPEKAQRFLVPIDTSRTIGDLFKEIGKRFKDNYCKGNAQSANNFFIVKLQDVYGNDLDCLDFVGDIFDAASKEQHQVNVIRGSLSRMSSIPVGSALHPAGYTFPSSSLTSQVQSSDPDRSLNGIAGEDYHRLNADHPITSTESAEPTPVDALNRLNKDSAATHAAITYSQDLEPSLADTSQFIQEQNTSPPNSGFRVPALPKRKLANVDSAGSSHAAKEPNPKRAKPSPGSSLVKDQVAPSLSRKSTTPSVPKRPLAQNTSSAPARRHARRLSRSPEPRAAPAKPSIEPSKGSSELRASDPVDSHIVDTGGNTPPGFYVNHVNSPEARATRTQKGSDFPCSTPAAQDHPAQAANQGLPSSMPSNSLLSNSSRATPTSSNNLGRTVWTTTKRPTPTTSRQDSPGSPTCARCKRGKRRCDRDGKAKCLRCRRNGWECWTDAPNEGASSQGASHSSNRSTSALSSSLSKLDKGKQKATDPFTISAEFARRRASGLFKGVLIREGLPDATSPGPSSSQSSPSQLHPVKSIINAQAARRSNEREGGASGSTAASAAQGHSKASSSQRLPPTGSAIALSSRNSAGHENNAAISAAGKTPPKSQTHATRQQIVDGNAEAHTRQRSNKEEKSGPGSVDSDRPPARFSPSDGGETTSNESHGTDSEAHGGDGNSYDNHYEQNHPGSTLESEQTVTNPNAATSDTVGCEQIAGMNDDKPVTGTSVWGPDSDQQLVNAESALDVKYEPAHSWPSLQDIASAQAGIDPAESPRDVNYFSLSSSSSSDEDLEQRSSDEDDPILQSELQAAAERAGSDVRPGTPGQKRLLRSFNELITSTWPSFSSQGNSDRPWYEVPPATAPPSEAIEDQAKTFVM